MACCGGNLPALKNKNLRDPGPQAFGFLTSARAVSPIAFMDKVMIGTAAVDLGHPASSTFLSQFRFCASEAAWKKMGS